MNYLLFFLFLFILSWLLTKIRFVKNAGLSPAIIIVIFLCKISAGVVAGKITEGAKVSDSWQYHREALQEYTLLWEHPTEYFGNIFYSGYSNKYGGFFQTHNSYWNDLKSNLIVKFISVLNLFSGGNYYINVLLFNFLLFGGYIGIFRVFDAIYKPNKILLVFTIFLLPSFLFYSSTIHKDGLVFASLGVLIFNVFTATEVAGFNVRRWFNILFALTLLICFRSYIVLAVLPAMAGYYISYKTNYAPLLVLSLIYSATIIAFFALHYVLPSINLPAAFIVRQADFLSLEKGNTNISITKLQPDALSFLSNLPEAFNHSILRPWFGDIKKSFFLIPLAVELFCYQTIIILFVFFRRKEIKISPIITALVFFSLFMLLIIGYTVPNLGAIIRYRSIYLPLLLTPLFCGIDWHNFLLKIRIKK